MVSQDKQQIQPYKTNFWVILFLIFLFGSLIPFQRYYGTVAPCFLFVYIGIFIILIIHELGHYVCCKLVGFTCSKMYLGKLKIVFDEKTTFHENDTFIRWAVVCYPRNPTHFRKKLILICAAGSLFNLLLAIIQFVVGKKITLVMDWSDPWLRWKIGMACGYAMTFFYSFIFAIINLIPFRGGVLSSDGAIIRLMLTDSLETDCVEAMMIFESKLMQGLRPRDLEPALIRKMTALSDRSLRDLAGRMCALYYYFDKEEWDAAGTEMDYLLENLDKINKLTRPTFEVALAYFLAYYRQDAVKARELLDQSLCRDTLSERSFLLLSEACVLLSEGQMEAAKLKAQEGLKYVTKKIYLKKWLEAVMLRADSSPLPPIASAAEKQ